jgi:hypothetical protein
VGVSRKGEWDLEAVFLSRGGGYPGTDIADDLAIEKGEKDEWGCFFLNGCNGGGLSITLL